MKYRPKKRFSPLFQTFISLPKFSFEPSTVACSNIPAVSPDRRAHLGDPGVRLRVAAGLKGGVADQTLVAEDADAPQVHLLVVGPTLDHLRGQVVQRAAQRGSPGAAKRGIRVTNVQRL